MRLCACKGGPADGGGGLEVAELDLYEPELDNAPIGAAAAVVVRLLEVLEVIGTGTEQEDAAAKRRLMEALQLPAAARAVLATWLVRGELRLWLPDTGPVELRLADAQAVTPHLAVLIGNGQAGAS